MSSLLVAFVPPPEILAAILACAAIPAALLLLARRPWRIEALGARFKAAVALSAALWLVLLLVLPDWRTGEFLDHAVNLLASALVLVTGVLVGFSVWSLLAYGFTVSMLLSLARSPGPLTLDAWRRTYGEVGLDQFAQDRLGVLLGFRLVRREGERIDVVPGPGELIGRLVRIAFALFNIDRGLAR